MNRNTGIVLVIAGLLALSACKSNKEAYEKAYQRMKDKAINSTALPDDAPSTGTKVLANVQPSIGTSVQPSTGTNVQPSTGTNVQPSTAVIPVLAADTALQIKTEALSLITGKPTDLKTYNVVAATFLNRTNSNSMYERLLTENFPALLLQNADKLYRIVAYSTDDVQFAEQKLKELLSVYPKAVLIKRK